MDNRKLTRSDDRMIAGVCAGLAEYFGCDSISYTYDCDAGEEMVIIQMMIM